MEEVSNGKITKTKTIKSCDQKLKQNQDIDVSTSEIVSKPPNLQEKLMNVEDEIVNNIPATRMN